ncbi:hypothetical protein DXN05_14455 [Deminuibacter soli]|uniref:Uncharacterized protein n=1 Tax=Deminuibacter soli TaxID=2291815 RepID=A0A3E1NH15_9BACT|nr:hypothetical protein DXN05_14455 [Deminuibacter soli]
MAFKPRHVMCTGGNACAQHGMFYLYAVKRMPQPFSSNPAFQLQVKYTIERLASVAIHQVFKKNQLSSHMWLFAFVRWVLVLFAAANCSR